ncbi:MAG: GNAT family N-acetyltransferase [Chthoniobacterales bacterium]
MPELPVLHTERLVLRPFEISDGSRVKELAGDRKISDTTSAVPYPYEQGMAEAWIALHGNEFSSGKGMTLAVTLRNGPLIGAIGLEAKSQNYHAEIGYWIGVPYWNAGYCTEALRAVIDYIFSALSYRKITARHLVANPASGRVMEKAGMKREGELINVLFKNGEFQTVAIYSVSSQG